MKYISHLTHHKFFLPIALIFGPIAIITVLWFIAGAVYNLTDAPGYFDDLPSDATGLQRFGYTFGGVLVLVLVLTWYIILPVCLLVGISLLVRRLFKKDAPYAKN